MKLGTHLKHRPGGLNFFELIISTLIISITSVAVASSFYTAYGELNRQRRSQRANQLLKAEAEYWMGRVHSTKLTAYEQSHRIPNPNNPVLLDPVYTYTQHGKQIKAYLYMIDFKRVELFETKATPDWYEVRVAIEYNEPPLDMVGARSNYREKQVVKELVVPFIPAAI